MNVNEEEEIFDGCESFVDYLIQKMKVLTYEEFLSQHFRYFLFESYYESYKKYCKKNGIAIEIIDFNSYF